MLKTALIGAAFACAAGLAQAATTATVTLDADTIATGIALDTAPLSTGLGNVNFEGEILSNCNALGTFGAPASGACFDILVANVDAVLSFGFDVSFASFVYGGDSGTFEIEARDSVGAVIDSFVRPTATGATGGPITLAGTGIRSLTWRDSTTGYVLAPIDNIAVTGTIASAVPLPAGGLMLLSALAGGLLLRRRARV